MSTTDDLKCVERKSISLGRGDGMKTVVTGGGGPVGSKSRTRMRRGGITVTFSAKSLFARSLGDDESPGRVDAYEMAQAEVQIRRALSGPVGKERDRLFSEVTETIRSHEIQDHLAPDQAAALGVLLGGATAPLLYEPGTMLDTPTSIRSEVLDLLAGQWTERSPFAASGALAEQVNHSERTTVIGQLDAALAAFDTAMKRLPPAEAGRPIEGAYVLAKAEVARQTLELTQSRLRQPGVWTAIDTLPKKKAWAFAAASSADTGLANDDMAALTREVRYALAKKDPTAVSDVTKLWSALEAAMGADVDPSDPAAGFARIEYRDGKAGQSFQRDARGIDDTLAKLSAFRVFGGLPTG